MWPPRQLRTRDMWDLERWAPRQLGTFGHLEKWLPVQLDTRDMWAQGKLGYVTTWTTGTCHDLGNWDMSRTGQLGHVMTWTLGTCWH